jgi:uncharacterized membrane protein
VVSLGEVRDAFRVRDGYWFAPKLYGFGATPVTWQGWAVTLGFAAALMVAVRWLPTTPEKLIVSLALIVALIAISAAKTDGDWHWRWGRR